MQTSDLILAVSSIFLLIALLHLYRKVRDRGLLSRKKFAKRNSLDFVPEGSLEIAPFFIKNIGFYEKQGVVYINQHAHLFGLLFSIQVRYFNADLEMVLDNETRYVAEVTFIDSTYPWLDIPASYNQRHGKYLSNIGVDISDFLLEYECGLSIGPWGLLLIASRGRFSNYERILNEALPRAKLLVSEINQPN